MLKIYAKRDEEARLLPILAEFRCRVVASYPIKGHTRKIAGKNSYKVVNFPITGGKLAIKYALGYVEEYQNIEESESL